MDILFYLNIFTTYLITTLKFFRDLPLILEVSPFETSISVFPTQRKENALHHLTLLNENNNAKISSPYIWKSQIHVIFTNNILHNCCPLSYFCTEFVWKMRYPWRHHAGKYWWQDLSPIEYFRDGKSPAQVHPIINKFYNYHTQRCNSGAKVWWTKTSSLAQSSEFQTAKNRHKSRTANIIIPWNKQINKTSARTLCQIRSGNTDRTGMR